MVKSRGRDISLSAAVLLVSASLFTNVAARSLAANRGRAVLEARALSTAAGLPGTWTYLGCYSDDVGSRTIADKTYADGQGMTGQACVDYCRASGFIYAGTEYSQECFCGNRLKTGVAKNDDADCSMGCSGDATQACGGPGRLTIYTDGRQESAGPKVNPGTAQFESYGCYMDGGARALSQGVAINGDTTVAKCISACSGAGFKYAGLEYSYECYCGNSIDNDHGPATDGCTMTCQGNDQEYCGGGYRLNMYGPPRAKPTSAQPAPQSSQTAPEVCTCPSTRQTSSVDNALGGSPSPSQSAVLVESPLSSIAPLTSGVTASAVFDALAQTSAVSSVVDDTPPPKPTTPVVDGDPDAPTPTPTPSAVEVATTPTGALSTANPSTTGSANQLPPAWTYAGCYVDNAGGQRALAAGQPDSNTLTVESCIAICTDKGFSVAGLEYSVQCFCDNYIRNGAALAAEDTQCGMRCSGNADQKCGGPDRLSIYGIAPVKVIQKPTPQNSSLPGSWKYKGCIADNVGGRALPYQTVRPKDNNATTCLTACSDFGYMAGGMEYGEECYCGDADRIPGGAQFVPEADCNMPCPGDPQAICGAGNRVTYYQWEGEPLYKWSYPSGVNAGRYQFLVDGKCIPLITQVTINGKISFQEKYGTQNANSGTGAWEFDPTTNGWREMQGLKTDIFCAAGLVLPDKAGRLVTFGGWSGTSTTGIRLYLPDGSPGVDGVNDWQENAAELALQDGRWYPSAMVMANGSILVIGGEEGSNGAPVPNLEVVPKAGGLLEMDWLRRTDPLNLYPFLAVLPGGGIFVAYYNEARILDERTFATTKILPMIPGAVNNPLAGRTYPLEGSMMIKPQRAPYTDPIEMLICGGSTPGFAAPLDNCVTLAPEVPNAQWTLERMPSVRVLSCMTALPDGTFLILNGAHKGVAGFGLAKDPNLNAVLYDPRKPLHARMSVLANTTIARMYHSEAILLPDARVLVSGSNPEDADFPEEYRVEVFLPPYLLNGTPQPTFTVQNKDWGYGQQVPLTVTSGSTRNIEISLMGAESSTHGATMGQRTFFPAFSCNGNTCTVTAPPNAHVCPPGWFQLFVLVDGTPSHSQFVRIGGDPARLGEWPNIEGFDRPGM